MIQDATRPLETVLQCCVNTDDLWILKRKKKNMLTDSFMNRGPLVVGFCIAECKLKHNLHPAQTESLILASSRWEFLAFPGVFATHH